MATKGDSPAASTAAPAGAPATPPAAGTAAEAAAAAAAVAASGGSPLKPWLPVIAALLLAPVATWATVEFVLLPRLQKKLAAVVAGTEPAEPAAPAKESSGGHGGGHGEKGGKEGKEGKGGGAPNYEFQNVVVNLSGTMGTRYLKTSFMVTGADAGIKEAFEENKPRLTDVTLNVLSSLTLADLEEPGAKNVIREKLVTAYNQAFGRKVAEQVYFSDFVIQ
ncbi:MAG: flagellar basal body-associated FliL family protein [Verrucomicrobiota bacterium]